MRTVLFKYRWIARLGLAVVVALAVFYFGPHLRWRLSAQWALTRDVQPVPVRPLADTPAPEPVARCHLGPVAVSIPAGMVIKPEFKGGRWCGAILRDQAREVLISFPADNRVSLEANRSELANLGGMTSLPRVQAEIYAASSSDFRWAMSREELARHRWRLGRAWLVRSPSVKAVETLFDGDVEGLLLIQERGAFFEWMSAGGVVAGMMSFEQRLGDFDLGWVRSVCVSLRYSGGVLDKEMTAEEVEKLFRVE